MKAKQEAEMKAKQSHEKEQIIHQREEFVLSKTDIHQKSLDDILADQKLKTRVTTQRLQALEKEQFATE